MRRLLSISLWSTVALAVPAVAQAQPDTRDHHDRDRDHRDHEPPNPNARPPAPINGQWPTEAPPPPHEEKVVAMRAGFYWVKGRWDWKDRKWAWMDGHWEKEQTGKHWRDARWEQKNDHWEFADGGWVDGGSVPVAGTPPPGPPPGAPGSPVTPHRHDWKIERPVVSSYWPTKGKVGSKVIVRGDNFPADAMVMWGGQEVKGAKISDHEIRFEVPTGATSATIMIHGGHERRPLIIGNFEVAADFDPIADQKRIDDERKKAAEAAWASQQAKWAKDKAAREAEYSKHWDEMDHNRDQRRLDREKEIRAKWEAAFLGDPDTQAELTLHAQRTAQLARMKDVAAIQGDQKLGVRIETATDRENTRHEARMQALHDSFKGGAK